MKTKNLFVAIVLVAGTTQLANAQFSARLDVGYGLPSGTQTMYSTDNNSTSKVFPYSFGAGANVALAGNYMFNNHVGAGLDLDMLYGSPVTSTDGASSPITVNYKFTGSLFTITPNLILSAHNDGINPYGRFGVVLGVASIKQEETASGSFAPSGTKINVYSGNLAIGWYAGVGVQFPLSNNLKLDVELFDRDLTYAPATNTNTQAFDGGKKDDTQTLVKSINSSSSSSTSLTTYYPFGSAGIKVGIELSLGN